MKRTEVMKDERTVAIEHASYRVAYLVLSYGLLLSTMYRSLVRDEGAWDLLGLVILGGAVSTLYQANFRVLSRRWLVLSAASAVAAAVVAVVIVLVLR